MLGTQIFKSAKWLPVTLSVYQEYLSSEQQHVQLGIEKLRKLQRQHEIHFTRESITV